MCGIIKLPYTTRWLTCGYWGSTVKAKPFDLSIKENSKEFGTWVLGGLKDTASGKVDVLVNNAGIFTPGSVHNEADGLLEKMMEINLYSAYHLTLYWYRQ